MVIVSRTILSDPAALDNVRGYDENNPTKPYITAVFEIYQQDFTVGDGKVYSYSVKTRRAVRSLDRYQNIQNVQLKPSTKYYITIRAHESEVRNVSFPFSYFVIDFMTK